MPRRKCTAITAVPTAGRSGSGRGETVTATEASGDVRLDGWRWASAEQPYIYEINTWPWLHQQSVESGRPVDLSTVPDERWAALADAGFDAVWLMGVWARSAAGSAIALNNTELVESFQAVLPDYRPQDVVGSPYCIGDYQVDPRLGGRDGLARARGALARHGLGLVLDFVPNHVAPDHPWTRTNPELFVHGSSQELQDDPGSFVAIDGSVLARGRDPYFPAWPDVVQLNAFSFALRDTVVDTLRDIAEQCDGVRCDMAMLMMNDVFARTWGLGSAQHPRRTTGPQSFPLFARRTPTSASSPRPIGISSGRCNSRASTSATTSASTTASWQARWGRSGPTCRRTGSISSGWSGSSRTTTSRGPPPRSTGVGNGPRR